MPGTVQDAEDITANRPSPVFNSWDRSETTSWKGGGRMVQRARREGKFGNLMIHRVAKLTHHFIELRDEVPGICPDTLIPPSFPPSSSTVEPSVSAFTKSVLAPDSNMGAGADQHHQATRGHQRGVLQFSSTLTESTWK